MSTLLFHLFICSLEILQFQDYFKITLLGITNTKKMSDQKGFVSNSSYNIKGYINTLFSCVTALVGLLCGCFPCLFFVCVFPCKSQEEEEPISATCSLCLSHFCHGSWARSWHMTSTISNFWDDLPLLSTLSTTSTLIEVFFSFKCIVNLRQSN